MLCQALHAYIRYVTRKTYLFPQTRRIIALYYIIVLLLLLHTRQCACVPMLYIVYYFVFLPGIGFPKVAARQCADRQRGILQIVCAAMRGRSADLYNAEEVLE